jgi:hypothetical protein
LKPKTGQARHRSQLPGLRALPTSNLYGQSELALGFRLQILSFRFAYQAALQSMQLSFVDALVGVIHNCQCFGHHLETLACLPSVSDVFRQKTEDVLLDLLSRAGITGPDQDLPPSVRLRQGVGREGKRLRYYLNYSRAPQSFSYPHASGTDLLTGRPIQKSQPVSLEPWGLIIVEEG